jgi:8-oxo-dGTP pyrophosphatase MutT (NUDIX family)
MLKPSSDPILQACAIPYRVEAGRIEVCVVTSRRKRRWVFPKGIVEAGETDRQAALKEAREEAGVRGRIVNEALGSYERRKWGLRFVVTCYLMHVDRQQRTWRESSLRERAWLTLEEAAKRIGPDGQREMLALAKKLLKHAGSRAG